MSKIYPSVNRPIENMPDGNTRPALDDHPQGVLKSL